uniref:Uncharacterized protein n=1 Tax=Anguilla anguilla TaxID=7936 RepID=A0A0E9RJJ2_ANGAN
MWKQRGVLPQCVSQAPVWTECPHQLSSENSAISGTNMQEYCMALVCVCTCAFVCARVCIVCVCICVCECRCLRVQVVTVDNL